MAFRRTFRTLKRRFPTTYRALRKTPRSRKARSNRIFRRFIRRTATRPELKHITLDYNTGSIGLQTGSAGNNYTQSLTPLILPRGTEGDQRIGNQVNFIKVDVRLWIADNSNQTTPLNAPNHHSFPVRMIVWTPRRPYLQSAAHVQGLGMASIVDYDLVTVFADITRTIYISYVEESGSNEPAPGGGPSQVIVTRKFKFPRKIKFTDANNDLDPQKDVLYLTWLCNAENEAGIVGYVNARTWYYDS